MSLQGNLDVALLFAHPLTTKSSSSSSSFSSSYVHTLSTAVRCMLSSFGTQRYIANLGHGMLPELEAAGLEYYINCVHVISKELREEEMRRERVEVGLKVLSAMGKLMVAVGGIGIDDVCV